ncbi:glutathione S-transferase [Vandammella animalimorsus]|uniref:Glutathione S-transferase n=1 Tax=Vandammella animalimorsus TaxID=2029117 RepID=A0A2A2T5H4_9BURK|nr:glutathione S-transferase family protein [Vandammella animalimorsus]PAT32204.1 glutathione S-transferase [Vandammella animalimorsus]PAX16686.1 glutathione S-transferase [Vandammella animalimorsus]PAX19316.1 glutathione S-transferase [Vandammella animalimorsus]
MQIFFSPYSPFVRKCLITAWELGLHERIELLPSNAHPVQRSQALVAINPLGKVPTFYTDTQEVLYDSRVICEYLNALAQGEIFPCQLGPRMQALTLQALGDGMLEACLLARYEEVARPAAYQWADWRAAQLDKVRSGLAHLEPQAAQLAQRVDIGTITLACLLWYLDLRFAAYGWRGQYPQLADWYAAFSQRGSMRHEWALAPGG